MQNKRTAVGLLVAGAVAVVLHANPNAAPASGGLIVYETRGYYGGPADIHVVNSDGTGDLNLTPQTETSMELDPQLSPDGARIVFISNRVTEQNPDGNFEIFTMAIDGTDVRQLTVTEDVFDQGAVQSYNPTWSPDGRQIAFDGYRGLYEPSEIYVIDSDGSGERKITAPADQANKWLPDWSPDGSKILYTWGWDYYSQDVHVINPDGTGHANLTPDTDSTAEGGAVWSPDGTRIAFSGDGALPGLYPNPNREIFVMEYPSLVITQVTDNAAVDEDPSWSSDGTEITFASDRDGTYALYVIAGPPVATASLFAVPSRAYDSTAPSTTTASLFAVASDSTVLLAETTVRKLDPTTGEETDPFWGSADIQVDLTSKDPQIRRGENLTFTARLENITSIPQGIAFAVLVVPPVGPGIVLIPPTPIAMPGRNVVTVNQVVPIPPNAPTGQWRLIAVVVRPKETGFAMLDSSVMPFTVN